jgi:hypothetical protein
MGHSDDVISDVREQIDASDAPLAEARARLALVKGIAGGFPGALRTYSSGSIAHHTMIAPVTDGDGGVVLDRRSYPQLGPDGDGEEPRVVTEKLCALLGPEIRQRYPNARCGTSKRGPKIRFGEPVEDQDPTVDLAQRPAGQDRSPPSLASRRSPSRRQRLRRPHCRRALRSRGADDGRLELGTADQRCRHEPKSRLPSPEL